MTIYSIPISLLNKIYNAFDNNFFTELIKNYSQIGKESNTHFIMFTQVLINNPAGLEHLIVYNSLIQVAQRKCAVLQILKNQ